MNASIKKFKNWSIKTKLLLLTLMTLFSILILSLTSNYFSNTDRTLNLMLNGIRIHQNLLQTSVDELYLYKILKEPKYLDSSIQNIDKANQMIRDFLRVDKDLKTKTNTEIASSMFYNSPEIYNNDFEDAELFVSRLRVFNRLENHQMNETKKIALETLQLSEKIRQSLLDSITNASIDKSHEQLLTIQKHYSELIAELNILAKKVNKALILAMTLIAILLGGAIVLLALFISRSIVVPVKQIVNNFKIISKGNFQNTLSIDTRDEIGDLARSFNTIQTDFQNIISYTKKVANGDLSIELPLKSKEDELGIALNEMVKNLKEFRLKNEETIWLRSGINHLNETLLGDKNTCEVSENALTFLTNFIKAELGVIYIYDEEKECLSLTASIGLPNDQHDKNIRIGHGLVGNVAQSKQIKHITNVPSDYFSIFSATGQSKPKDLILVPLLFNNKLWGIMELATINSINKLEFDFIEAVQETIAVKIASTIARDRLETLLKTTQKQASELQVQQEELRVANEELAEQTKILTNNEKELQAQQEELRVANEELEERTSQLELQKEEIHKKNASLSETHEQLEVKARELEQTSQYKSDFLANMSHELRTPLNSLLILSGMLLKNKKGNLTEEDIESIQIINKSGNDLLQLINEILDLSKIEAGKMNVIFEKIKPEEITKDILTNFKHQAEKKKLDFSVHVEKAFPKTIETDQLRLSQILKNLLSNAFKFTSKGSVSVNLKQVNEDKVLWRKDLQEGKIFSITVSDTGVGIPEEKKEAIFEAFQQADGSTSRKYGGTGLGLSISKELARILGGEIQLESEVGKGSSFTLLLPVKQKPKAKTPVKETKEEEQTEKNTEETGKPLVLPFFIDDDREIPHCGASVILIHPDKKEATNLYYKIHDNNFHALVAADVKDAIRLIEAYQPSAIIIGLELLMLKGEDVLDALRKHPFASQLPMHIVNPVEGIKEKQQVDLPTVEATDLTKVIDKIQQDLFSDSKKILIVEDNDSTRKAIKKLLQSTDAEITEVSTGAEALELIHENNYDCVVLDLGLPDFTGNKLLEKLSKTKTSIPNTIIYTGKDLSRNEHRELSKYTNSIILKGLKSDERLMDEVTLFLHQVATKIPDNPSVTVTEIDDSIFKNKKILVVDDEIRNIFALGKLLEDKDMEVVEAENGKVAIEMLKENQNIDLILMDIMMPEMDGYEAMSIIRKTPEFQKIPIICLTAKAMKEDYEKAIFSGANDYLSKPIDEKKLFSMLKIWLYN